MEITVQSHCHQCYYYYQFFFQGSLTKSNKSNPSLYLFVFFSFIFVAVFHHQFNPGHQFFFCYLSLSSQFRTLESAYDQRKEFKLTHKLIRKKYFKRIKVRCRKKGRVWRGMVWNIDQRGRRKREKNHKTKSFM